MSFCQFEGAPCFRHTNYVFYKAFRYKYNDRNRILTSGDFFFLKILQEIPVCIGEIELLWEDKASNQLLASLRLYFRPEHTSEGRHEFTGEDEVIALGERLVLRLNDLVPMIQHNIRWSYGSATYCSRGDKSKEKLRDKSQGCERSVQEKVSGCEDVRNGNVIKSENGRKWNFETVKSKTVNSGKVGSGAANLAVMSYPKYCRYRAVQKRLEGIESEWLHLAVVVAIGGVSGRAPGCRVMFCRDTFYQAEFDDLEFRMNHMLPVLKGRPKGKKSKQPPQKDVQQDSDSMEEVFANVTPSVSSSTRPRRLTESSEVSEEKVSTEEQAFLIGLHKFMHDAKMPIGRIPSLGFKQIDLFYFYKQAEKLGGYDSITHKRMWKHLYDKLGGNSSNTSAATCTRKHYERLLLPYERQLRKLKVGKVKKKRQKEQKIEADIKDDAGDCSIPTVVTENVVIKTESEGKDEELVELETKENTATSNENSQCIQNESIDHKDEVTPAPTEHSKPDQQSDSQILESPAARPRTHDNSTFPSVDTKSLGSGSNSQHFSFGQTEQELGVKAPPGQTPALPSNVLMSADGQALRYANMVYPGGYLLPVLPHHLLHSPWGMIAPAVTSSSSSTLVPQSKIDGVSSLSGASVTDLPLTLLPSSSKTNQNSVPSIASSQDSRSKSSGKSTSQTYQLPSPSGSRSLKAAHTNASHKHAPFHFSDYIQPAHQSSRSSQKYSPDDLGSSSHSLASMLHPTPAGHRPQSQLPPPPTSVYLHPTSTQSLSLLQPPATFPPPVAHSNPRKRLYPFDSPTAPITGAFPSPDMVLDRIRNSTCLPSSNPVLISSPTVRQRFEDPRQIFRQIPQAMTASQNISPSQRKEPFLRQELVSSKQVATKSKNSGRKSQQNYSVYGPMPTTDLQQVPLHQRITVPSNNTKIVNQGKHTSNLNGLVPGQQTNKTSIPQANPVPSSSKDGRLTSALFGAQFTALPRTGKPPELASQSLMVDPSTAAVAAMSLNPHLHPAFMSPFLQPGLATATSAANPQLQMHTGPYVTPAQLSAYEEMLRQNGYGTFINTQTHGKGSKKN